MEISPNEVFFAKFQPAISARSRPEAISLVAVV
jgi:hypothetical protein